MVTEFLIFNFFGLDDDHADNWISYVRLLTTSLISRLNFNLVFKLIFSLDDRNVDN